MRIPPVSVLTGVAIVVLLLLTSLATSVQGLSLTAPANDGGFTYTSTGITRDLIWEFNQPPISISKETALHQSGVLIQRGEFGPLSTTRIEEIQDKCHSLGMTLPQGLSARKQALVTQTLYSNKKIKNKASQLSKLLGAGSMDILQLSTKYDQPPVAIMRAILDIRIREMNPYLLDKEYKRIVKTIIFGEMDNTPHLDDFLSKTEQEQLVIAKQSDTVSYATPYDTSEQDAATAWEEVLYQYLDQHNVQYVTEEALRDAGSEKTPDCLLLDDCIINGKHVRWIDCKNFFGSASANKYYMKLVQKQIQKYELAFNGPGAIVYRHGFSTLLQQGLSDTLLLDRGPLSPTIDPTLLEEEDII